MAVSRREKEKKEIRYASAKDRAEKHEKEFEPTALNIPEGCKLFRFKKEGTYRLDILPYLVKTGSETPGGNPYVDEGFYAYERTYFIHNVPTPDGNRKYCCLSKTFKQRKCPMCEWCNAQARKGVSWDDRKQFEPKDHQIFNIIDLDDKKAGVQVFAMNWFQFGKILDAKAKAKARYEEFYKLSGGFTLEVTVEEGTFNKRTTYTPISFEFEPREDYENDILEKVFDLDTMPKKLTYDEFAKIVNEGEVGEAASNGEAPKKTPTKSKASDPDDEDDEEEVPAKDKPKEKTASECNIKIGDYVNHPKLGECKVLKISPDGTSLTVKDGEDDTQSGVAPEECKLVPVKGKTPTKPTKGGKPAKGKVDPDEEDEDEDQDDDDTDDEEEDEDSDEDEDDFEDDDEEEPEPVKKAGRKEGGPRKGNVGGK